MTLEWTFLSNSRSDPSLKCITLQYTIIWHSSLLILAFDMGLRRLTFMGKKTYTGMNSEGWCYEKSSKWIMSEWTMFLTISLRTITSPKIWSVNMCVCIATEYYAGSTYLKQFKSRFSELTQINKWCTLSIKLVEWVFLKPSWVGVAKLGRNVTPH